MAWIILYYTLELFKWLIVARALMSWFVAPGSSNPIVGWIRKLTDPVLRPISDMVPDMGGVDLSPIVAFFAITVLQQLVVRIA